MSGLEKIISQIKEEAAKSAEEKLKAAREQADRIIAEAGAKCEAIAEEAEGMARQKEGDHKAQAESSAQQIHRTILLSTKQEIIAEVIEEAKRTLEEEDDEAYFELMERLLNKCVPDKDGEIYFSKKDLDRMPASFEEKINAAAESKGGKPALVKEPKDIPNGFIIAYGGVEENCTLDALFEEKKDQLCDMVNKILFG